jgi:hypothetical protein
VPVCFKHGEPILYTANICPACEHVTALRDTIVEHECSSCAGLRYDKQCKPYCMRRKCVYKIALVAL